MSNTPVPDLHRRRDWKAYALSGDDDDHDDADNEDDNEGNGEFFDLHLLASASRRQRQASPFSPLRPSTLIESPMRARTLFGDDYDDTVDSKEHTVVGLDEPNNDVTLDNGSIPIAHRRVILSALTSMNIRFPRKFQVNAIHQAAFDSASVTVVVAKTGSGKTAVPLTVGLLRRGVSIVLVPLIGLGATMVDSVADFDRGIEAYHLEEYKDVEDYRVLKTRLHGLHRDRVVYLFSSPQSLSGSSKWWPTMLTLAKTNRISLVCIDEAHDVIQQGRNFRPEFIDAVMCIETLYRASPSPFPRIAMSATLLRDDIDSLLRLLNVVPANANLIWTKMNRRTIFLMLMCRVTHQYLFAPASSTITARVCWRTQR